MPAERESAPHDEDLVVRKMTESATKYSIGTYSGAPQLLCDRHAEAIARADAFARRLKIRVWYTENEVEFSLVRDYR